MSNRIESPFSKGDVVRLPAGTPVKSTHPSRSTWVTKRAMNVKVHHSSNGWIDLWNDSKKGCGYVILPTLTWPGTGGYWCDVKLTPELCEALGIEVPALPELDRIDRDGLDTGPQYGAGYDNRDTFHLEVQ